MFKVLRSLELRVEKASTNCELASLQEFRSLQMTMRLFRSVLQKAEIKIPEHTDPVLEEASQKPAQQALKLEQLQAGDILIASAERLYLSKKAAGELVSWKELFSMLWERCMRWLFGSSFPTAIQYLGDTKEGKNRVAFMGSGGVKLYEFTEERLRGCELLRPNWSAMQQSVARLNRYFWWLHKWVNDSKLQRIYNGSQAVLKEALDRASEKYRAQMDYARSLSQGGTPDSFLTETVDEFKTRVLQGLQAAARTAGEAGYKSRTPLLGRLSRWREDSYNLPVMPPSTTFEKNMSSAEFLAKLWLQVGVDFCHLHSFDPPHLSSLQSHKILPSNLGESRFLSPVAAN